MKDKKDKTNMITADMNTPKTSDQGNIVRNDKDNSFSQEFNKIANADETAKTGNNNSKSLDNSIFSDAAWKKTRIFIIGAEDFIPEAKRPLHDDKLTIGYGHTEGVKEGDTITREEAEELYKKDFKKYSSPLKNVKVPLNDNEKTALTSFIYNVGIGAFNNSTLLKKLNEGDKKGAAAEFDKWIYKNGRVEKGLKNRRKQEKELFLTEEDKDFL